MALTGDVKATRYGVGGNVHQQLNLGLAATTTVYRGSIALKNASGYLKNSASPLSTDTCMGLVEQALNIANTGPGIVGTSTNGAVLVDIATGTFFLSAGTAGDALTIADIGSKVYVIDEVTVGKTDGSATRPVAGTLVAVDSSQPGGYAIKLGNFTGDTSP